MVRNDKGNHGQLPGRGDGHLLGSMVSSPSNFLSIKLWTKIYSPAEATRKSLKSLIGMFCKVGNVNACEEIHNVITNGEGIDNG